MLVGHLRYRRHCIHQLLGLEEVSEEVVFERDPPSVGLQDELPEADVFVAVVERSKHSSLIVIGATHLVEHHGTDAQDRRSAEIIELDTDLCTSVGHEKI